MIYTVTFSPAVDYVVDLPSLRLGEINRSRAEEAYPGGKGINVSLVLAHLGTSSVALGFLGGFTGSFISEELRKQGIASEFIPVEGNTRINVKIRGKEETAINGQGPKISEKDIAALLEKLSKLGESDILVISGAVPATLPSDIYERIVSLVAPAGCRVIVDATGETLLKTLPFHPFLVKPNREELQELAGRPIKDDASLIESAERLLELGAQNVLVSLGGDGAVLVGKSAEPTFIPAPQGEVKNTVGAGDSLVAGFLHEYLRCGDLISAARFGVKVGSASAFCDGLIGPKEAKALLE